MRAVMPEVPRALDERRARGGDHRSVEPVRIQALPGGAATVDGGLRLSWECGAAEI